MQGRGLQHLHTSTLCSRLMFTLRRAPLQAPMVAVGEGDPGVVVATLRQALEALSRLSNERASLEEALKVPGGLVVFALLPVCVQRRHGQQAMVEVSTRWSFSPRSLAECMGKMPANYMYVLKLDIGAAGGKEQG